MTAYSKRSDFRDRPEFLLLVTAVRAEDAVAVDALWDLLEDCQATTADVMTLYALPPAPPCPQCGNRFIGGYCEGNGHPPPKALRGYDNAEDDSLRPVLACWTDRHGPPGWAGKVRSWEVLHVPDLAGNPHWSVRGHGPEPFSIPWPTCHSEAAARRELKRRVLGLWPELRVPCPNCKGKGAVVRSGPLAGPCIRCYGSGAVTPADLIPPESQRRVIPRPPPAGSVYPNLEPS